MKNKSFVVEVIADSDAKWIANGLRFETEEAARTWGSELFGRWTAVREYRVVPSVDEPNYPAKPVLSEIDTEIEDAMNTPPAVAVKKD